MGMATTAPAMGLSPWADNFFDPTMQPPPNMMDFAIGMPWLPRSPTPPGAYSPRDTTERASRYYGPPPWQAREAAGGSERPLSMQLTHDDEAPPSPPDSPSPDHVG